MHTVHKMAASSCLCHSQTLAVALPVSVKRKIVSLGHIVTLTHIITINLKGWMDFFFSKQFLKRLPFTSLGTGGGVSMICSATIQGANGKFAAMQTNAHGLGSVFSSSLVNLQEHQPASSL